MKGRRWLLHGIIFFLIHALFSVPRVYGQTFDCLVKPYVLVNVSSGVEGVLESVTVDRGDRVKQGQVLAKLESNAEQATVARQQARASMEATIEINQARLELSRRQHSRSTGLYKKALIAADELDTVETTKRLAELELQEALENKHLAALDLQRATAELARRTIKSPINGVVVERLRHPGEFADDNPILTLAQLHPLRVDVFVPVAFLRQVTAGMRAKVMPEAPVGGVYEASVTTVDRIVDAASGMFGVRLELPNHNYDLSAGLKCQVRFPITEAPQLRVSEAQNMPTTSSDAGDASPPAPLPAPPSTPAADVPQAAPTAQETPVAASRDVPTPTASLTPITGVVQPDETASELFVRAGIDIGQVLTLQQDIRPVYDIRLLRPGHAYSILRTPEGQLQRFIYEINRQQRLVVERQQGTFVGRREPMPSAPEERLASAQPSRSDTPAH